MKGKSSKLTKISIVLVMIFFIFSLFKIGITTVHAVPIEDSSNWSIYFDNIQVQEGSITATITPTIADSLTEINYAINLDTPGQFYEFTVDVKNNGSINAILDEVLSTTLTAEQQKYLLYTVTYSDNKVVAKNDIINAGATKTIKVRVEFKKDITVADLPSTNSTLELTLSLHYVQTEDEEPENPDTPEEPEKPDEPSDEPEHPDQPDTPDEPSDEPGEDTPSEEPEKPSEKGDNEGKEDPGSNANKENTTPQTGDSILIYVAIVFFALVFLIIVSKISDKTEEKN